MFSVWKYDPEGLASVTAYPRIPTYHAIGSFNCLQGNRRETAPDLNDPSLVVTEKLDGEHVRILVTRDDVLIGDRDRLCWRFRDYLYTKSNIVPVLRETVEALWSRVSDSTDLLAEDTMLVIYGELVDGPARDPSGSGSVAGSKSLDGGPLQLFVFDVATVSAKSLDVGDATQPPVDVRQWLPFDRVIGICERLSLSAVTPRVLLSRPRDESLAATSEWLTSLGLRAGAEGVVVRTQDRRAIAKICVADYRRAAALRRFPTQQMRP
jgi:ATP-dependent RNA circularization protein (DNA/RNA ligase family)